MEMCATIKGKNRGRVPVEEKGISSERQIFETAVSTIKNMLPQFTKSRIENGFMIKVFSVFIAYSASFLWQGSLT